MAADPFADAALSLIALSPGALRGQPFEEHVREQAAGFTRKTLVAARDIMDALSKHGVDITLDLVSLGRTAHARIQRDVAQDVWRILSDVESETRETEVVGRLRGFMEGERTTFRIEGDQDYRGNVPTQLRAAADGIPHGSRVRAIVDEITRKGPTGEGRVLYRLRSIEQVAEP